MNVETLLKFNRVPFSSLNISVGNKNLKRDDDGFGGDCPQLVWKVRGRYRFLIKSFLSPLAILATSVLPFSALV